MSLKTLIEKAKTYSEVFTEWQLAKTQTKDGIDNKLLYKQWVSVEDLKTFLDDYALVPHNYNFYVKFKNGASK